MKPKSKLYYVPMNLFFCLSSLFIAYLLLSSVGLTNGQSAVISLLFYFNEVRHESMLDWLNDKKLDKTEDGKL